MLHVFRRLEILTEDEAKRLLDRCDEVSRKIMNYVKTLGDER